MTTRTPNPRGPAYPGRAIQMGDTDRKTVSAIQARLNAKNCGPLEVDGDFGTKTRDAVKLFQTRTLDSGGRPLLRDGVVGALTWQALFGQGSVPSSHRPEAPLLRKVLKVAASQLHVREVPPDSNRGPEVDAYLRAAGLDPEGQNYSWCAAFVYWCFEQAAGRGSNPLYRTAGVLRHWREAGRRGTRRITAKEAQQNPGLIRPGFIFIIDSGGGKGHTGLVEAVNGGLLTTIEGNTNGEGSREGGGVHRLNYRKVADINTGYLDYST
ncbi:MAG TPA: CHAP domain-containing protein [Fibrobacteria bacterium]|nr:CHAP domain-containing protein [Fibrobacteria bacterium]